MQATFYQPIAWPLFSHPGYGRIRTSDVMDKSDFELFSVTATFAVMDKDLLQARLLPEEDKVRQLTLERRERGQTIPVRQDPL